MSISISSAQHSAGKPQVGRPSVTDHLQSWVREQLALEPPPTSSRLLALAREQRGYAGSNAAFFDMVRRVRGGGRIMPRPGDSTEHYLFEACVELEDGRSRALTVLGTSLRYSGYGLCTALPSTEARSVVLALEGHFRELSGVPRRMLLPACWSRTSGLRGASASGLHPLFELLADMLDVRLERCPTDRGSAARREAARRVGDALARACVRDEREAFARVAAARTPPPSHRASARIYRDLHALRLLPSALLRGEVA